MLPCADGIDTNFSPWHKSLCMTCFQSQVKCLIPSSAIPTLFSTNSTQNLLTIPSRHHLFSCLHKLAYDILPGQERISELAFIELIQFAKRVICTALERCKNDCFILQAKKQRRRKLSRHLAMIYDVAWLKIFDISTVWNALHLIFLPENSSFGL